MSEIRTDTINNASGDSDSGIDLSTNDVVAIKTANTERMRIESDGTLEFQGATDNVIKTNSDSSRTRIFGGSASSVGNGAALTLNGTSHSSGNYADLASGTSGTIRFRTGTTERMRILSGGQLVINATSLPVVGTEKLGVDGGGASNGVAVAGTCQHNNGIPLYLTNGSNTTNTYIARFATGSGGSTRGEIYFNGSSLVYATSSDYRLKENVNYDFDATTKVKQLKPAEYRWIEHQKDDIGFLAHEVQDVFPNAVGGEKDETNADGSIKPQSYDPSKLVPLLTKALQESITKIEALETRITALENA